MASVNREKNGTYSAVWRTAEGKRISVATGEVVIERALKRAAALESESRFWEYQQEDTWQRLADAGFSPRYLHDVFTCRAHVRFSTFRKLLAEAGIRFKAAASFRDRTQPKGPRSGKRWFYKGAKHTLDELMSHACEGVTVAALRYRLESKWDIQTALSTQPMSRSEAGARGASATNKRS